MQIHNLKKNKSNRKSVKVGRGGKRGKTSGRGTKGQNARSGRKKRPEMRDIIKRLPKLRGRGKNFLKSRLPEAISINLDLLENNFKAGETVSPQLLVEKGLLQTKNGKIPRVKILGGGKITKAVNFDKIEMSEAAKNMIVKAGGKVN